MVLETVLLSLVVIYLASKVGGELVNKLGLPPVLGELLGGVVIGNSVLHLLVLQDSGVDNAQSLIISLMEITSDLSKSDASLVANAQSEVISVLSELGVIILLFEIGLESNFQDLLAIGIPATLVAVTGVTVPLVVGSWGLIALFHISTIPARFY